MYGVEAIPVSVEVAVTQGLPGMTIVGMCDTAIQEARERVKAAIRSSGFSMPIDKIVVNIAPGDLKKSGSGFDLPIAVGILVATGQISGDISKHTLFVGELSLKGAVREYPGYLAFGMCAKKIGYKLASASDCEFPIEGLSQIKVRSLQSLREPENLIAETRGKVSSNSIDCELDFADVSGHETAKRALQIATAGELGILMSGPPGSGKTLLASRVPSILPKLSEKERLETAVIHSIACEPIDSIVDGKRPFRSPHHSATMPGMLGGGNPVRPGEVTLSHNGVLFLDELAEFKSSVLQGLRQPMESGEVVITRAAGSIKLPASFMLIGATNPCPCGYYGDIAHECKCSSTQITKYQGRVGGPLIDRFQMQIDVKRLPSNDVLKSGKGISSDKLREGVMIARDFSSWRQSLNSEVNLNKSNTKNKNSKKTRKRKSTASILAECNLDSSSEQYLTTFADSENLSGRSIVGLLQVARTIADIEQSQKVEIDHLAEAIGFRLSKTFGGA